MLLVMKERTKAQVRIRGNLCPVGSAPRCPSLRENFYNMHHATLPSAPKELSLSSRQANKTRQQPNNPEDGSILTRRMDDLSSRVIVKRPDMSSYGI